MAFRDLSAEVAEVFEESTYHVDPRRSYVQAGLRMINPRPEIARKEAGLCPRCGEPATRGVECSACRTSERARYQRRKRRLGIGGKEQGGFARARALSPERRKEIGRIAAKGRWGYSGQAIALVTPDEVEARFDIRYDRAPVPRKDRRYYAMDRVTGLRVGRRDASRKNLVRTLARALLELAGCLKKESKHGMR